MQALKQQYLIRQILAGYGTLGKLIAEHDWKNTSLENIESWPESLKTALSIILNSQHPMFIVWGEDNLFLYNDAYIPVLSHTKHPWALGRPFSEVWAEVWHICGPLTAKAFKGEATFLNNVQFILKRNNRMEESYYSFSYNPIMDSTNKVLGLFCPSTEVTQKLLNERRLRTLEKLSTKALLEKSVPQACSTAVKALTLNKEDIPFALLYLIHAKQMFAELAEAVGVKKDIAFISPHRVNLNRKQSHIHWPIYEVMQKGKPKIISISGFYQLPLGLAQLPIQEVILLPLILHGDKKAAGVLIAGINPCRPLDNEYQSFFKLVAQQVSIAMQNAAAAESVKQRSEELIRLDQAKTKFFSNVSHELRTPLTLMMGPVEDLLANPEIQAQPYIENNLKLTYRNTLRLLRLVNALLEFSRMEAGRINAKFTPTNIVKLTTDVASTFRSAIENANLKFNIDISPISSMVLVDKTMWEKILLNLISNAFKFTFMGEISVSLHQDYHNLHLSVKDSGIGISKKDLPFIFERFHRIESAEGRSYEGTGLGLALVNEYVGLHGGKITVKSQLSVGSEFKIKIPLKPAKNILEHVTEEQSLSSKNLIYSFSEEARKWLPTLPQQKKPTVRKNKLPYILLADDNADMREYIHHLLESQWEVKSASDGLTALMMAQSNPPQLIITDVMMPNLDGFGLVQKIRENPKLCSIPIILLSARAGEESRIEGFQAGADDYLIKPFSGKELIARIQTHLHLNELRLLTINYKNKAELNLKRAIAARDEFVSVASHELKTPITSLKLHIQMIRRKIYLEQQSVENNRLSKMLDIACEQVDRLTMIVDDLFDISKIRAGNLTLEYKPTCLKQLTDNVLQRYAYELCLKQNTVEVDIPKRVIGHWDTNRIEQVIINLLHNAIKYAPGKPIYISANEQNGWATYTMIDNGPGIAKEKQALIFKRFERISKSKTTNGLGLGLFIVKNIVEMHKGKIEVKSTLGKGTCFTITLPLQVN